MAETLKSSMPPVGMANARLLLLGSLPGDASLAAQRYYAHPTNQFWRLLGAALSENLATLPYEKRLDRLAARGVALWDVVDSAERRGSLDSAIRGASHNALAHFAANHPRLVAIGFNGRTAATIGRRALGNPAITLIDLPSSSAAFTLSFEAKQAQWQLLADFADPA